MNDYSEYLKQPGMLAWIEQEWKANPKMHDMHADIVNKWIEKAKLGTVTEIGCGNGALASRLNDIRYIGMDSNEACIESAKAKNADKMFIVGDIRNLPEAGTHKQDLALSFGFLKHFGLHEWSDIFQKVASLGKYFIFDIPIASQVMDDGVEYHHVWMSMERIKEEIEKAGLKLIETFNPEAVEPVFVCKSKQRDIKIDPPVQSFKSSK